MKFALSKIWESQSNIFSIHIHTQHKTVAVGICTGATFYYVRSSVFYHHGNQFI